MIDGMKRALLAIVLASGCTVIETVGDTEVDETTSSSSSTSGLLPTSAEPEGASSSTWSTTTTGSDDVSEDDGGCDFIGCEPSPDAPPSCDPMLQDCPRGYKCNIYINDGGTSYNAARCVPIVDDPDLPDEACTVEGSAVSGLDSCALGSVCAWVDFETGVGVCQPMCLGPDTNPSCADENRVCIVGGDAIPAFCFSRCDPLVQDCPEGLACYGYFEPVVCSASWSEPDAALLDACSTPSSCPAGTTCVGAENVGACPPDADACCASFCDLEAPDCPEPQTCRPYFTEPAPEGLESVGFCGASQ